MSEGTLASAVAVPEQDNLRQSPEFPTKRRRSSATDHDSKRRRFSNEGDLSPHSQHRQLSPPASAAPEKPTERKPARQGREDERRRGQRLFGALLGTLSQRGSNSPAQKRRADIEKRQQDKLKSQAEEYDGLRKRRKERRELIRKKEKPFYEREAMRTRHSNLIAMAHFLKTSTEPVLYYKPWQLRSGDEAVIREQIEETEARIAREVAEFEAQYPSEAFVPEKLEPIAKEQQPVGHEEESRNAQQQAESTTEPASAPNPEKTSAETISAAEIHGSKEQGLEQAPSDVASRDEQEIAGHDHDAHRAHDDDGGEVEEDNEDTVIY
ncbi:hypothetical protein N7462_005076 [Penicillium macrosclerotiorum]|uniref:uncharacterized protein n=1 Tax=Penicillium macrosclerotiorum TaxID=303699 RepID=UPI002548D7CC|nr:uncharacterized protein N7462_005076 [Penicillium macrosclerotiorum]KAJ5690684.1 hypothetical protein N7462_005076 [Penicillium macrosclerotiorum]